MTGPEAADAASSPLRFTECPVCGHRRIVGRRCRYCEPDDPALARLRKAQQSAAPARATAFPLRRRNRNARGDGAA